MIFRFHSATVGVLAMILVVGCTGTDASTDSLFRLLSPRESGIQFTNTIVEEQDKYNLVDYYYVYNGGGVALGDINNDGLVDIYFTGNRVTSRLYVNRGDLMFEDITETAGVGTEGWATGATFADVNADGFLDLYVGRAGPTLPEERANYFFVNNGDLTFSDEATTLGIADTSYATQASFFDYDKDGDLDLFLLNHSNEDRPNMVRQMLTDGTGLANDRLYRQEDDGSFTDVTVQAGILKAGLSLGVGINDLDGDGWEDIYVSNDFMVHDYLFMNNQDGTFAEKGSEFFKHHSFASMGHDIADINNDGLVDLFVLDMRPPDAEQQKRQAFPMTEDYFGMSLQAGYHPQYWRNVLQLNEGLSDAGDPVFSEIGQYAGIDATGWSWGPLFADFDNDGWRDLLVTNGYLRAVVDWDFINKYVEYQLEFGVRDSKDKVKALAKEVYDIARVDYLYRNNRELGFDDVTTEWGFTNLSFSNGGAVADLDNDGDLEIVVNQINAPGAVYENRSVDPNFLKLKLKGTGKNTLGMGSDIYLYCDGMLQYHHHSVSRGYQSAVENAIHFGLGTCTGVDSLRVIWPTGESQLVRQLEGRQTLVVKQEDASAFRRPDVQRPSALLTDATQRTGVSYRHVEEPFNDFQRQRLLPHKHSRQGPGVASADVNGDGRDDFLIGGAYRHSGSLFMQQANGTFSESTIDTESPKYEEDTGMLFFDADSDGDQDLYIASGSSEFLNGTPYLQDRFYLNDGTGSFERSSSALPDVSTSSSCVVSADYDQDGDLDVFVCGRVQPLQYPRPGHSYILRNDGAIFTDVTDQVAPGVKEVGMVSAALWSDFNQDGRFDLILVGEFMSLRFFENRADSFHEVTDGTGLEDRTGWWNSLVGGDFDDDGDTDYVAGNLGLNNKFDATPEEPVRVYGGDFDFNGHIDPFVTLYIQGVEYPMASFEDFTYQLPEQKLYYQTIEAYGKTPFQNLFPPERRVGSLILEANGFDNMYVENLGDGRFVMRPLPGRAQLGPLFGLVSDDVDGDGHLDIVTVGNSYAPDVVTGRYNALNGIYLRGNGDGSFAAVPFQESGLFVPGDAKGLSRLVGTDGAKIYVATENDGPVRIFSTGPSGSTFVDLQTLDAVAEISFEDGSVRREELYYGSGYLSQSSRRLWVPDGTVSIRIRQFDGSERSVSIDVTP